MKHICGSSNTVVWKLIINELQAFRFMVGLGHCPMISKYGPSLSKAVDPVDPSFLVVKISQFNKNIHLTVSLRTPQNRKYMKVVNTVKHEPQRP